MKHKSQILNIIQDNARLSDQSISEMLSISEDEVRATRETLEKQGVIIRYETVINPNHTESPPHVRALIELSVRPEKSDGYDAVAKKISKNEFVIDHYLVSGNYDFLIIMEGRSLKQISDFVSELASMKNTSKTATHVVLKTYKKNGLEVHSPKQESRLPISP